MSQTAARLILMLLPTSVLFFAFLGPIALLWIPVAGVLFLPLAREMGRSWRAMTEMAEE